MARLTIFRLLECLLLFVFATVSAHSRFDTEPSQQSLSGDIEKNAPLIVSVRSEASVSHIAELATFEISASASATSKDLALHELSIVVARMQDLFTMLSETGGATQEQHKRAPVEKWSSSGTHFGKGGDVNDARKHGVLQHLSPLERIVKDQEPSDREDEGKHRATHSFSVHLQRLDSLSEFVSNITNTSNVNIDWVDWRLSDSTRTSLRSELRTKAIKDLLEAGQDYAKPLGFQTTRIAGIDEEYSYENSRRCHRGFACLSGGNQAVSLEPTEVEIRTNVVGKLVME